MKKLSSALSLRRSRTIILSLVIIATLASLGLSVSSNTEVPKNASASSSGSPSTAPQARATGDSRMQSPLFTNPLFNFLMPAVSIKARMTDAVIPGDADGIADVNETIRYTVTIINGSDPANNVNFSLTPGTGTTYVDNSVNAFPIARDDSYNTAIGNTLFKVGVAAGTDPEVRVTGSVKDNDTDFLGDTPQVVAITDGPTNTPGGIVNMNTDGTFTYLPPVGFTGTDTFTYTLTDDGPDDSFATTTDNLTTTATVSITVSNRVWYVNNAYLGLDSDGRSTRPYKLLSDVSNVADLDSTGDYIYVFTGSGSYPGGIALESQQSLIGNGVALVVGSTTVRAAGTKPTITNVAGNAVSATDVSGITIRGFNLSTTTLAGNSAIDVTASSTVGNVEISDNIITGTNAEGIDINVTGGTITLSLHDNSVTGGTTTTAHGIDITRTSGTLTITAFDDNTVTGTTGGTGINVVGTGARIIFDSNTGLTGAQQVSGGVTAIGQPGDGVGVSGLVLDNIAGDLAFTDLDIYASGGTALEIDSTSPNYNASGTITGAQVIASGGNATLSAVNGPAVDAREVRINLVLSSLTSSGSGTTGVSLFETSGTFNAPSGSSISIIPSGNAAFYVDGNSANGANVGVTYAGTITSDTGRLVNIQNIAAAATSTHNYSGLISDNQDSGGADGAESGILLQNISGATINFSGGLNINTTTNTAFSASGGGTISATQNNSSIVNTLSSVSNTALTVSGTNISSSGLTFRSINAGNNTAAAEPVNGILLSSTGTAAGNGGLTVTGNSSGNCGGVSNPSTSPVIADCTGGTIQKTSGTGIALTSTKNPSFTRIYVFDASGDGIKATTVGGLSVISSYLDSNGNQTTPDEANLYMSEAFGTATITNTWISNSFETDLRVENSNATNGALTVNMSGSTVSNNGASTQVGNLFNFLPQVTSNMTLNLSNSRFVGNRVAGALTGDAVHANNSGGTSVVNVSSSTFVNNFVGIGIGLGGNANSKSMSYDLNGNTITGTEGSAINITAVTGVAGDTISGKVRNNTIGTSGVANSGSLLGFGMDIDNESIATYTAAITNNTIREIRRFDGINARQVVSAGTTNVTITGNTLSNINNDQAANIFGIVVSNTIAGGTTCANISGNTLPAIPNGNGFRMRVREAAGTLRITQAAPTAAANAAELDDANSINGLVEVIGTLDFSQPACATVAMLDMQQQQSGREYFAQADDASRGISNSSLLAFLNQSDRVLLSTIVAHAIAVEENGKSASAAPVQSELSSGAHFAPGTRTASTWKWSNPFVASAEERASATETASASKQSEMELAHGGSKRKGAESNALASRTNATAMSPMPGDVNANLGNLPANTTVVLVFDVTVDEPHPIEKYSNQGTVTANSMTPVQTDDPDINGIDTIPPDPTVTLGDRYDTSTSLSAAPPSPAFSGQTVTFTAIVSATEADGTANPTNGGSVQFKDGVTNIGLPVPCVLDGDNCKAELLTSSLSVGPHSITATYLGGTNHDPSAPSTAVNYTINPCTPNPEVTNTADTTSPVTAGSLRDAMMKVCPTVGNNTITFAADPGEAFDPASAPHVISLTAALPAIDRNMIIQGPGANVLEVQGSQVNLNSFRVFTVTSAATNASISGLTVANGGETQGAGIDNAGTLTLLDCAIGRPGANGTNLATTSGGGIYNSGTLTIDRCTISNNVATTSGGGIFNALLATLTVKNSTISNNTSNGGNNTGGGVSNGGTATFTNVTVAANLLGGGIVNLNIVPTSFTIGNTIVADSAGGSDDTTGVFNSQGNNLVETPGASLFNATGDQTGADPVLGALGNNGGRTLTHALLTGSPAIEAGNNTLATNAGLTTDQRGTGFPRNADSADVNATQTVDIGAFELHPSIENITDKTTVEDTPLEVTFNIGDATGSGSPLITSVVATSGDTAIVTNANLVIGAVSGSDTQRKLTITPEASANGTVTITVTVTATNGRTAVDTFDLTVTGVNDAPVANPDALASVDEDSGQRTIAIADLLANDNAGPSESGQSLTLTAVGSAVGGTVSHDATNVFFTPTAHFNGAASFQYTIQDNGTTNGSPDPQSATGTASFTITAVNDSIGTTAPGAISPQEDDVNFAVTGMFISDVDATLAPAGVYEVSLSSTNGTLTLTTLTGLTFTAGDGTSDTSMTFHGTLADINTALATTTYTPTANYSGSAQIQFNATDTFGGIVATGTGAATNDGNTISVTVTAVNDVPTITAGATLSYTEGDPATVIDNTITVADVDNANIASATAQITGNYANGQDVLSFVNTATISGLFDTSTGKLTLTGSDTLANYQAALRSVMYENTSGNPSTLARTVTWIVNDGSDPSAAATSTITVAAVNSAPVNTVPGAQSVDEDTDLVFSTANGNAISVADVDVGSGDLTVTLTVNNGVLTLASTAGLTSHSGDGTGSVTLTGTQTNVNAAMNGLKYRGNLDFNGGDTLTVGANDNGNTGTGGAKTDSDQVAITVNAGNDAPTLTNNGLTVNEDAVGTITSAELALTDADNPAASTLVFELVSVSANGKLFNNGTELVVGNTFTQADINSNFITYDHDGSETTSDSFNFTATDGTDNIPSTAFNITVTPQNDTPTLATNVALTVVPGTTGTIGNSNLAVTDPDNTTTELVYTVGTAPAHGDLKNNGATLASGGTFTQEDIDNNLVTFTHDGGPDSTDSFTFTVSDGAGGSIALTTFDININCVTTTTVTNTNDTGAGSLRDAITTACPDNTITFNIPTSDPNYDSGTNTYTIKFASELTIDRNLTINGPTTSRVILSGEDVTRIFSINTGATVVLSNLTIANGRADIGGGIFNLGNLTINNSTLRDNDAVLPFGDGGAIDSDGGMLTINNSTISGNTSAGGGGGIHNCGDSTAVLTNVTVTGNRSNTDDASPGEGGGIEQVSTSTISLRNTIVAGNTTGTASPVADDIFVLPAPGVGALSGFNNLVGVDTGLVGITNGSNGNQVGTAAAPLDAKLGALSDNGGPTPTHSLLPGSPAINTGDNCVFDNSCVPALAAALTTDQRGTGFSRKVGTVDIGAYEVQAGIANSLAFGVQPSNTIAGAAITPAVTVQILDVLGNLTTSTASVTLAIGTNPSAGTLSGTTTVAAVAGTATFSNLSINNVGAGYTLVATSTGLTGATSNAFNITSPALVTGTKSVSGTFTIGSTVIYTIVLTNTGPGAQLNNAGNEFTDTLPAGITFVNTSASSGTANFLVGINSVLWNGSIPSGGSVTITINATINAGTTGQTISNQGTINYDADGDGVNNEVNTLTDDPNVAGANNPTNFLVNAAPTIAAAAVTTTAGSPVSNVTIANVNDAEDAENTLGVTINGGNSATVNNVTVSGLSVSAAGVVTANVLAACNATAANFTLQVTDSASISNSTTLAVAVNPNPAPVLSYSGAGNTAFGGSVNVNPATGPSDNGTITSIVVQNNGTYTGTVSVNSTTGVVSFSNASPAGLHFLTIRATDNCGSITDTQVAVEVAKQPTTTTLAPSANPSTPGQNVTFTATVTSPLNTPTGIVDFIVDSGNPVASVALNASGVASFSSSTLTQGSHTIIANYRGDANFSSSTTSFVHIVNDPGVVSISDVQLAEGNSGTTDFVFTVSLSSAGNLPITVDFATGPGIPNTISATAPSDYAALSGTLTFAPGDTSETVTIQVNGDTGNEANETFTVNLSNPTNVSIFDGLGIGTIVNDDGPVVQLSQASYQINEGINNTPQGFGALSIDVTRTGDSALPGTVRYFTSDQSGGNECNQVTGQASQRCDYLLVGATLRFAAGETTKTIKIPIVNDGYVEGNEFFSIQLANPVGMTIGATNQASITIEDNDSTATTGANNPYLSVPFFVRMNYLDYLGRDADQQGFTDWSAVLNNCGPQQGFLGAPPACDRAHVAHGFFGSPEFIGSGFLIYRMFEVGMGRLPLYREFIPDMATLSGHNIPPAIAQQNLADYLQEFTAKQEFINRYGTALQTSQAAQLIALMEQAAGITLPATATTLPGQPPQYGRNELIQKRQTGEFTVGETLKAFVEQKITYDTFFERGQVTMLYFAHLRRDPNLNDPNLVGWTEWVDVFTNGRPSQGIPPRDIHHLIFGFIYSEEYRKRFGQP